MKQNIYSTFDTAAGIYSSPLFANSDGEIMRAFTDLVQNADHPIGQHPEDYSLFRMGTYDNINGEFNNENNECLTTGLEALSRAKNPQADKLRKLNDAIGDREIGSVSFAAQKDAM